MAVQTSYSYSTSRGIPGGIYDLSHRAVNSRMAEEKMTFGIGVVQGSIPGSTSPFRRVPLYLRTLTVFP